MRYKTMKQFIIISLTCFSFIVSASNHEKLYSGTYFWGSEVHSFKSCNKNEVYWVSFDWAGNKMHEFYKKHSTKPYQAMYIEFRGQELNEVLDGFAIDYSGLLRISEVKKFTFDVPKQCK